uniref:Uncharacterized protein n=1 Tax=Trichogramma kaykai TaxID=54128 RepID=A0ABD2W6U3_9HYME
MSSEGPIDTLGTTTTTMMIGLCCSGGWRCIKLASDARSHIQTRMLAGGREREREKEKKRRNIHPLVAVMTYSDCCSSQLQPRESHTQQEKDKEEKKRYSACCTLRGSRTGL